jgi:aspartyl-tRNA(Asn)/glutamyl-tRNA(Gln) amidotransferase subunit A
VPFDTLAGPGIAPDVAEAVRNAARVFEGLGAKITGVDFPDLDGGIAAYYLVCTAEASSNLARYEGIRYGPRSEARDLHELYATTRDRHFGAEVKRRIMLGTYALSSGYYEAFYGRAMKARDELRRRFRSLFTEHDLLLVPTSPTAAFRIGEKTSDPLAMYLADVFTVFANLTGAPALSIPGGFTADGLPIGIQLTAAHLGEQTLFAAAAAFEAGTGFHRRRPGGLPA